MAAETAARASYGRLVATITRRTRDLAAAEDALAEAFRAAIEQWPTRGVPDQPEAWLLTVARRMHGHAVRHAAVAAATRPTLAILAAEAAADEPGAVDRRLELMFACAHPAIDRAVHTPLMLQMVLGLDAGRIAAAFLAAPSAIGQRLVRAKAKIRDAGIAFELPGADALQPRLAAVLDAVYVAYGTGWDAVAGADPKIRGLSAEALFLARLLAELCPEQPEARGLYALLLYCEARATARRADGDAYMPLAEQDAGLWSKPMIAEAERQLRAAAAARRYGRYQTEAAIQSLHIEAVATGRPNPDGLARLYDLLAANDPAVGVLVARAAAHGAAAPATGLACLDAIPPALVRDYQPYWATRAHLEGRAGHADAPASYDRAIGLAQDPAVRRFLQRRRTLGEVSSPCLDSGRKPEQV